MFSTPFTFLKQPSGGGGGFSPTDISGLKSWHDAANASTVTLSGTNVTAWADASGNGFDFAKPVDKNAPKYGTITLNGIPVISSTQDGTLLYRNSYGLDATIQGGTIFFVGTQDADPPDKNFGRFIGARFAYQFWFGKYGADKISGGFFNDTRGFVAVPNQFYTVTCIGTTTQTYLYPNGNPAAGTVPFTYTPNYADFGIALFGEFNGGGIQEIRKSLAEIIIYDRTLNSEEIGQVETYLRDKWAHY